MKYTVWVLAVVLFFAHQDLWNWDDTTLVFGFMPMGLFYHAMFSVAAATVWLLAVKFAWPSEVEAWADELDGDASATPTEGSEQ